MLDPEQRIWGFETNFGGLADVALVKANQLMPKPEHLTWEEAASPGLVNCTAYRQLVSKNGGDMKQGDNVLIWGASGGLGGFATQYALNGGATPVCVVSSDDKAEICRSMGAELIINRNEEGYRFWKDEHTQDPKEWKRFGARIRELTGGEDIDIVFEHPGRETFGASVFVTRKGGMITTCASTSGFMHEYDNRYLWMNLKRIISSHFANYRESWEANRLIAKGMIHPTLSRTYPLDDVGQAALDVHQNAHQGKVGVLCLAPEEGLGVRNEELRATARDRDQPLPRRLSGDSSKDVTHPAGFSGGHRQSWSPSAHPAETRNAPMTDQGLSIFDDEPDDVDAPETDPSAKDTADGGTDGEKTQVIPVVEKAPEPKPAQELPEKRPVIPPRPLRGLGALPAPSPARPSSSANGGTPTFPVVRRNGYDRTAVDTKVRQLSSEKAGLSASLTEAERRVMQLEAEVAAARDEISEQESPSYAGLGGRASAMLRLAEEEADEIRGHRHRRGRGDPRAGQPRRQGDPRRGRPRGGGHAGRAARGARRAAQPPDQGRRAGARRWPRARPPTPSPPPSARPTSSGWPPSRRPTSCAPRATREVEQARAAADREVQEARRTLAVEKERLAREATDHHTSAMTETQRLVEEAEQRASAAEERAREATKQATEHRAAAQSEAEALLLRARREAEQIVAVGADPGGLGRQRRRLRGPAARSRRPRPSSSASPSAATRSPPSSPRSATSSPASPRTTVEPDPRPLTGARASRRTRPHRVRARPRGPSAPSEGRGGRRRGGAPTTSGIPASRSSAGRRSSSGSSAASACSRRTSCSPR